MHYDVKSQTARFGCWAEQRLAYLKMTAAAHGQILCQPLYDTKD